MSFKMEIGKINKNKKAVLGGIMTTFIATLIILVLLVIFAFFSGFVKLISGVDSGVRLENKVLELGVGGEYSFDYMKSFSELTALRFLMDSQTREGDFSNFKDMMVGWNSQNTKSVLEGVHFLKPKGVSIVAENFKAGKWFACDQTNDCRESGMTYFSLTPTEFWVSPYNVKIKIAYGGMF